MSYTRTHLRIITIQLNTVLFKPNHALQICFAVVVVVAKALLSNNTIFVGHGNNNLRQAKPCMTKPQLHSVTNCHTLTQTDARTMSFTNCTRTREVNNTAQTVDLTHTRINHCPPSTPLSHIDSVTFRCVLLPLYS